MHMIQVMKSIYKLFILMWELHTHIMCGDYVNLPYIWNITPQHKFTSTWSFMCFDAGILKINGCMKPTFCIALQTNFVVICTLKCMVHRFPYYWVNHLATITDIWKVKQYLYPQYHLQMINIMELIECLWRKK